MWRFLWRAGFSGVCAGIELLEKGIGNVSAAPGTTLFPGNARMFKRQLGKIHVNDFEFVESHT